MNTALLAVHVLALFAAPMLVIASQHQYEVDVWARVLFGVDGTVSTLEFVNAGTQPPLFLERISNVVAQARITPPTVEGKAATFRTGMRVSITVNREESSFKISGVEPAPLVLIQKFEPYPRNLAWTDRWEDTLAVSCVVQTNGLCRDIRVRRPGAPESAKRFARESLERWKFEPQEVAGIPIESEYRAVWNMKTVDER